MEVKACTSWRERWTDHVCHSGGSLENIRVEKIERKKMKYTKIKLCFSVSWMCPAYKGTSHPHQLCMQVPVFSPFEISLLVPVSGGCINISLFVCFIKNECPKRVLYMNLESTRPRGRPWNRWQDEVREDGRIVGGEEWQENVYNREEWKTLLWTVSNCCVLHMSMEWIN
jgi:hypothetical protein